MKAAAGDFLLPVDKPEGPTSHDVVAAARRALGTRRIGHTGTLDPFASGVLVLCVGRATRLAEYVSGFDKRYSAAARLGTETDTLDRDGDVTDRSEAWRTLTVSDLEGALRNLEGPLDQIPPQFSAKKVDGEAMHRKARRGEHVDLDPARVVVYEISLLSTELPDVRFDVHCSTGTYIRALARDLGRVLGSGAHLTGLRRTSVGPWTIEEAVPFSSLDEEAVVRRARVEPLDALGHLPSVEVSEESVVRIFNGQRIRLDTSTQLRAGAVSSSLPNGLDPSHPSLDPSHTGLDIPLVTVAHEGDLVAVAEVASGVLHPRKVFPS